MIDQFVYCFSDEKIDYVKLDRSFYLVSEELKPLVEKKKPFCAGLFLGEQKGKEFEPSLALLEIIAKHSNKKVILNHKAAWLFLCERDIFSEGLLKLPKDIFKGELVLVQNEFDENLGYGKVIDDLTKRGKVVIINKLDRGHFLRKERKKTGKK